MKRVLSLILIISFALSFTASAVEADNDTVAEVVSALEIMTGDERGNMNLDKPVTRAEFTKMMAAASVYKDSVTTGSGFSLFKDVKSSHWASGYISTAIDAKWMTGYVDGTFRPNNTITYEEGASAVLRLLGYIATDLSGAYPHAHIRKFESLKLNSGITPAQGKPLTRFECMYIFYNLMGATLKTGGVYGVTLGYTMNSDGEIDYDVHVKGEIEGPIIMTNAALSSVLPFNVNGAVIYRNNKLSTASAVTRYDVLYYNESTKNVWAYSDRAIGKYTAVAPNAVSPSQITVGGNIYTLETKTAKEKASVTGDFALGDTVAVLLGMNGTVVDILPVSEIDGVFYGVVTNSAMVTYPNNSSTSSAEYTVTVSCTDGVTREAVVGGNNFSVGNIVTISYSKGELAVDGVGSSNLSGVFSLNGQRFGNLALSADVEIMDVSKEGTFTLIEPSRLSGVTLDTGKVRYHKLDANGELSHLILNDVTGDMYAYGVITSAQESRTDSPGGIGSAAGVYQYIIDGRSGVYSPSNTVLNIVSGPALFYYKNGQINSIKNLSIVSLSDLTALSATADNKTYKLADNIQVYIKSGDSYNQTTLSAVNTSDYRLSGCYETIYPAGGILRIIIASPDKNNSN